MAILYKLWQDNRSSSSYKGKWYGRAIHQNTVDLSAISDRIQRNCSMKKSDVMAVLIELVEVMKDELQNSNVVKIDGFGLFKVGLQTKPAATAAEFNPARNVTGYRVNFLPASHSVPNGVNTKGNARHKVIRDLLDGASCKEAAKNAVDTSKKTDVKAGE